MSSVPFRDSTNEHQPQPSDAKTNSAEASKAPPPADHEMSTSFFEDSIGEETPSAIEQFGNDENESAMEVSSLSIADSLSQTGELLEEELATESALADNPKESEQCVSVFLRVRPFTNTEESRNEKEALKVISSEDGITELDVNGEPHRYQFTKVMGPESSQTDIFNSIGKGAVEAALTKNRFSFLFTHGVSNSGKSYTVLGDSENPGLLPQIVSSFAEKSEEDNSIRTTLSVLEVAGKTMKDLVEPNNSVVFQDRGRKKVSNFSISNLSEHKFERIESANALINSALARRATACTGMNEASSRSHALFIIKCYGASSDDEEEQCIGGITLVDMAGAERIDKSCSKGELKDQQQRTKESGQINGSLFALFECFRELQSCSKAAGKGSGTLDARKVNPVFRRQKEPLVKVIQPYLTGQIGKTKSSQVMVLLTAYPGYHDVGEKKSVFRQAQNALGTSMKFSNIPSRISTYRPNNSSRVKGSASKRNRDYADRLVGTSVEDEETTAETPQKRRHTNDGVLTAPLSDKKGIYLHILRMKVARQVRDAAIRRFSCPTPKSTKKSISKRGKRSNRKDASQIMEDDSDIETPRKLDFSEQRRQRSEQQSKQQEEELKFQREAASYLFNTFMSIASEVNEDNPNLSEQAPTLQNQTQQSLKSTIDGICDHVMNSIQKANHCQYKDDQITELEAKVSSLKQENKTKAEENFRANSRISELLDRLDNVETERNEFQEALENKQKEVDQVTEHISTRRSEMVKLRTEFARVQAELSNINSDYEALSAEHQETNARNEELVFEVEQLKEQFNLEKEDLRSTGEREVEFGSNKIQELNGQIRELEQGKVEMERELSSLREELQTSRENAKQCDETLEQLRSRSQEEVENTETYRQQMESVNLELEQLKGTNAKLNEKLSHSEKELQALKNQATEQQQDTVTKNASLSEKLMKTEIELCQAKQRMEAMKEYEARKLGALEDAKTLLKRRVNCVEAILGERGQALVKAQMVSIATNLQNIGIKKELESLKESLNETQNGSEESARKMRELEIEVEDLTLQNAKLENTRHRLQKCLQDRTDSENSLREDNKDKIEQVEQLQQELQNARSDLNGKQSEIHYYSNQYHMIKEECEKGISQKQKEVDDLSDQLSSMSKHLAIVQQAYDKLRRERFELNKVVGIPENHVSIKPIPEMFKWNQRSEKQEPISYAEKLSNSEALCKMSIKPAADGKATKADSSQDTELLETIRQMKEGRKQISKRLEMLCHSRNQIQAKLSEERKARENSESRRKSVEQELSKLQYKLSNEMGPKDQEIQSLTASQKLLRSLLSSLVASMRNKKGWRKAVAVSMAQFFGISREELCRSFLNGEQQEYVDLLTKRCGKSTAEYFVDIMNSYSDDTKETIEMSGSTTPEEDAIAGFSQVGRSGKPV